jgi:RNA 2',3'-cyclic 3'-phosphodiesterase
MKRLFIAADISEEARRYASDIIGRLRSQHSGKGISWTRPESLHFTIKFLGDTEPERESKLIETLPGIAASATPFRLHFEKPELLGKRVISIAVQSDSKTVYALEMAIDTECERFGFEREGRRFHPHLTLGRIRQLDGTRELAKSFLQTQIEPLSFDVREIVLYESELGPGGSVYRKVGTFPMEASEELKSDN